MTFDTRKIAYPCVVKNYCRGGKILDKFRRRYISDLTIVRKNEKEKQNEILRTKHNLIKIIGYRKIFKK